MSSGGILSGGLDLELCTERLYMAFHSGIKEGMGLEAKEEDLVRHIELLLPSITSSWLKIMEWNKGKPLFFGMIEEVCCSYLPKLLDMSSFPSNISSCPSDTREGAVRALYGMVVCAKLALDQIPPGADSNVAFRSIRQEVVVQRLQVDQLWSEHDSRLKAIDREELKLAGSSYESLVKQIKALRKGFKDHSSQQSPLSSHYSSLSSKSSQESPQSSGRSSLWGAEEHSLQKPLGSSHDPFSQEPPQSSGQSSEQEELIREKAMEGSADLFRRLTAELAMESGKAVAELDQDILKVTHRLLGRLLGREPKGLAEYAREVLGHLLSLVPFCKVLSGSNTQTNFQQAWAGARSTIEEILQVVKSAIEQLGGTISDTQEEEAMQRILHGYKNACEHLLQQELAEEENIMTSSADEELFGLSNKELAKLLASLLQLKKSRESKGALEVCKLPMQAASQRAEESERSFGHLVCQVPEFSFCDKLPGQQTAQQARGVVKDSGTPAFPPVGRNEPDCRTPTSKVVVEDLSIPLFSLRLAQSPQEGQASTSNSFCANGSQGATRFKLQAEQFGVGAARAGPHGTKQARGWDQLKEGQATGQKHIGRGVGGGPSGRGQGNPGGQAAGGGHTSCGDKLAMDVYVNSSLVDADFSAMSTKWAASFHPTVHSPNPNVKAAEHLQELLRNFYELQDLTITCGYSEGILRKWAEGLREPLGIQEPCLLVAQSGWGLVYRNKTPDTRTMIWYIGSFVHPLETFEPQIVQGLINKELPKHIGRMDPSRWCFMVTPKEGLRLQAAIANGQLPNVRVNFCGDYVKGCAVG